MRDYFHRFIAIAAVAITSSSLAAGEHVSGCDKKDGVEKLRCERHVKMAEKCGPLKSEAHFACDREFLIANPLDCAKLSDAAANSCTAETKAFKSCETNQGREFMKCVAKTTNENPMGH
jgi:hypothetical protein